MPAQATVRPARPRKLLIFDLNVGYGGHPSAKVANVAFTLMGQKTGAFETEVSNDPAVFQRESLKRFDAVFFNNTVGNCFTNAELRQNLLEFVTGGGGLLGVHGTSVAFTRWPGAIEDWPEFGVMLGARGANHKASDEHVWIKLDDRDHPLNRVFGGPFATCAVLRSCQAAPTSTVSAGDEGARSAAGAAAPGPAGRGAGRAGG